MKKTRRQKVFCILACILLCASFFVCPLAVSAADDSEGKYYNSFIGYNDRYYAVRAGYRLDYSLSDAYSFIDTHTIPQIINEADSGIEHSEGYYDYDYQSYIVDEYFDPDAPGFSFGVFTLAFACDIVTLPQLEYALTETFIQDGSLRFFSENIIVSEVRFSIRAVEKDTDRILTVWSSSAPISVGSSNVNWTSFNVVYEYDQLFDFRNINMTCPVLPVRYVLCVDFGFRRSPDHGIGFENFSINVDDMFYADVYNYSNDYPLIGPDPPSGGGDDGTVIIPPDSVVGNWDTSFLENGSLLLNQTLDKFDGSEASLQSLTNEFKSLLPSFKNGLLNVSVMLGYLVDDLPFASFLITFSLLMGLISFVFNLASSAAGARASSRERSTSDRKEE